MVGRFCWYTNTADEAPAAAPAPTPAATAVQPLQGAQGLGGWESGLQHSRCHSRSLLLLLLLFLSFLISFVVLLLHCCEYPKTPGIWDNPGPQAWPHVVPRSAGVVMSMIMALTVAVVLVLPYKLLLCQLWTCCHRG